MKRPTGKMAAQSWCNCDFHKQAFAMWNKRQPKLPRYKVVHVQWLLDRGASRKDVARLFDVSLSTLNRALVRWGASAKCWLRRNRLVVLFSLLRRILAQWLLSLL